MLVNFGKDIFTVTRGMRIAQLVIAEVAKVDLYETGVITETVRGAGGFGSTGTGRREGQE